MKKYFKSLRDYYKEQGDNSKLMREALGWIAAVFILLGYYLNANMYASSWLMWAMGNLFMGGYCFYKKAYPAAIMSFALIILNIYGYFRWCQMS